MLELVGVALVHQPAPVHDHDGEGPLEPVVVVEHLVDGGGGVGRQLTAGGPLGGRPRDAVGLFGEVDEVTGGPPVYRSVRLPVAATDAGGLAGEALGQPDRDEGHHHHDHRHDVQDRPVPRPVEARKIQIGRVCWFPAVKVVTMISSNERAKASMPPARRAVPTVGSST